MRGWLGLGSNQGDRRHCLQRALELLTERGVRIVRRSRLYETRPVEVAAPQDPYLNAVVEIATDLDAHALLDVCLEVERLLGRARPYHHAPRTLDIDVLLLEGEMIDEARLTVPHPRLEQRAFVIYPLAELENALVLPSGRGILEVKQTLALDEILGDWAWDDGTDGGQKENHSRHR